MLLAFFSFAVLAVYAVLISFYYRHWKRLPVYKPSLPARVFVSVVIAARNEEETLPLLIDDLRQQDYPQSLFEIIVVDDFSTDHTAAIAAHLPTNGRVILPACGPENSSKKKAIATGIATAKGPLILVTDADCRVGKRWVSTISSFQAEKNATFIAAPVKYVYQKTLLQVLQVLDFITLQGITAASVGAGFHTMCNGANLAYTKDAFDGVDGFAGIDRVPTGDDMLLMHKIWKQDPGSVFYLKSAEAIVSTAPALSWKAFFAQRRRWASKTLVFDDSRIIAVLVFVLLLNVLPFVLLIAGVFKSIYLLGLLVFLTVKTIIETPFVSSVANFYGEKKLMRYFFLLQPLHVFYTVFVGVWSQFGSYEWKGRKATVQ